MNCPKCGAENPDAHAYCTECGTALRTVAGPPPIAQSETPRPATHDEPPPIPRASHGVYGAQASQGGYGSPAPPLPIAKGFHMGMAGAGLGAIALAILVIVLAALAQAPGLAVLGVLLYLAGAITFSVMFLINIYKTWAAIQDGFARTGPGKALGFIFIPFFNFYWVFQAVFGFAQDYNRYLDRNNIDAHRLPEGLYLTYCILLCCTAVPYLGILVGLVAMCIWYFAMLPKNLDAVNALAYNA